MRPNTLKFGRLAIAAMCLMLLAAGPALSQGAPRRPSGGLFGATRSDIGGPGKLNFTFELAEGVDSELPPEIGSLAPRGLQNGGLSTLLATSTSYARNGRRLQLAGTASTAFKYYQRLDRLDALSHSAGLGADVRLPKQGSLRVDQTAAYSPSYLYQLFPIGELPTLGASVPSNPEYQIEETPSYSYRTALALAFGSLRGTLVTTSGTFSRTDFQRQTTTRPNLEVYETGAKIDRALSRSGGVSLQYQYRTGEFGFGGLTKEHRVTIGTEYSPALSRTRRATFRFNLTPARLDIPESALVRITSGEVGEVNGRVHRLDGEASVSYPFRPNWRAAASYRRAVEYLAVLREPVFSDGARAELTGLIARRLDLSALAGYAAAASALSRGSQNLDTYTAEVRIRYALKRSFALYSEYRYYYYDLLGQAGLAPDLPRVFEQHGVRIGFILFVETLGR